MCFVCNASCIVSMCEIIYYFGAKPFTRRRCCCCELTGTAWLDIHVCMIFYNTKYSSLKLLYMDKSIWIFGMSCMKYKNLLQILIRFTLIKCDNRQVKLLTYSMWLIRTSVQPFFISYWCKFGYILWKCVTCFLYVAIKRFAHHFI